MPHKNECCFNCGVRFEIHGDGKHLRKGTVCTNKEWEFIPVSSRDDDMIDFTVMIQSESSRKKYEVIIWKYGDASCRCTGWRNYRKCKHIDRVVANIDHYRREEGKLQAAGGSVTETVAALKMKMDAMEAAVKRGDPVEINKLQAEIEMQQQMFQIAGEGLGERFNNVMDNIRRHAYGDMLPARVVQSSPEVKSVNADVFGVDDDPFSDN